MAHSELVGGSTAGVTLRCPGSILERRKVPNRASLAAVTGTVLHTIVEECITDEISDIAGLKKKYVGRDFGSLLHKEDEIEEFGANLVTVEMIENKVMTALGFFYSLIDERDIDFVLEEKVKFDAQPESCWPDLAIHDGDKFASGTADVLLVEYDESGERPTYAAILDWKFGDGFIVNPETDRAQFMFYLAGGIHSGILPELDTYEIFVFQPAERLRVDEYVKSTVVTFEEITNFINDVKDATENALSGDPHYETGPHCKYCKGRVACKAYRDFLSGVVETEVNGLNNQELSVALSMLDGLKAYIKDVEQLALKTLSDGTGVPGYRLNEDTLGNRTYKDEDAAGAALGRLGLKQKERTVTSQISPAQALKALKAAGVTEKQIGRFEDRHIIRPKGKPKLEKCAPGEDVTGFESLANAMNTL